MRYEFKDEGKTVGFYEFNPFPGCNQLVVSNHSFINPSERGKGLGTKLSEEKIDIATQLGYDYMIATVKAGNECQIRAMEKNGWQFLTTFHNRETGNEIYIYGRELDGQGS